VTTNLSEHGGNGKSSTLAGADDASGNFVVVGEGKQNRQSHINSATEPLPA